MTQYLKRPLLWLIIIVLSTSGCTRIFENDQDVQARKALQDLMVIQEQFHGQAGRYAKSLLELAQYNLKYHSGIVYLELQKATKDHWRAIALAAESTSARVFAFDSERGGYYEMEEEEVAQYVLGALNHIRKQQSDRVMVDYLSGVMLVVLLGFGLRMFGRYREPRAGAIWSSYFLCLLPLAFTVIALNHMSRDIYLSTELLTLMGSAFGASLLCILLAILGFIKTPERGDYHVLKGIAVCVVFISLFSSAILTQTYYKYSQPKSNNTLYFKENR